jgi:peptide/nickel transport system permease protein
MRHDGRAGVTEALGDAGPRAVRGERRVTRPIAPLLGVVRANKRLAFGAAVVGLFALGGLLAPFVAPFGPLKEHYTQTLAPPRWPYLLGTDEFGRDILSRLMYGARVSLSISGLGVCVAAVVGIPVGMLAGYYGKLVDFVLMRIADLVIVFPSIFLALALVSLFGPGVGTIVIVIGVTYFPRFARLAYVTTNAMKVNLYVEASHANGASDLRIFARHILPNIVTPLLVQSCLALGFGIILEGGLSFLGYGVQPPNASWGVMINGARAVIAQDPLVLIWPCLALTLCVLAINIVGDELRDVLDPRMGRGMRTT